MQPSNRIKDAWLGLDGKSSLSLVWDPFLKCHGVHAAQIHLASRQDSLQIFKPPIIVIIAVSVYLLGSYNIKLGQDLETA